MGLLSDLDRASRDYSTTDNARGGQKFIRAPFGWPGGKFKSLKYILPHLPRTPKYVEPFGGSAAVLLARPPSDLEVYNDRFGGVVAFYRCIRDPQLFERLVEFLELTLHAKEEFYVFQETWRDCEDPVERAGRWYAMATYSFGQMGRNWGRTLAARGRLSGKIQRAFPLFETAHARFKNVQVENQDWFDCMVDYDSHETLFYCDPPYVESYHGAYENMMGHSEHVKLLDTVFSCSAAVAMSGYSNELYEAQDWDERYEWETRVTLDGFSYTKGNGREGIKDVHQHKNATEVLWIKYANRLKGLKG